MSRSRECALDQIGRVLRTSSGCRRGLAPGIFPPADRADCGTDAAFAPALPTFGNIRALALPGVDGTRRFSPSIETTGPCATSLGRPTSLRDITRPQPDLARCRKSCVLRSSFGHSSICASILRRIKSRDDKGLPAPPAGWEIGKGFATEPSRRPRALVRPDCEPRESLLASVRSPDREAARLGGGLRPCCLQSAAIASLTSDILGSTLGATDLCRASMRPTSASVLVHRALCEAAALVNAFSACRRRPQSPTIPETARQLAKVNSLASHVWSAIGFPVCEQVGAACSACSVSSETNNRMAVERLWDGDGP